MGDHEGGTGKGAEGLLQDLLAGHVEVVGGLVEDEEIGRDEQHPGQCQTVLFSPGEDTDRFGHVVLAEEEGAEDGPDVGFAGPDGGCRGLLEDGALAVHFLALVLGEVAYVDLVPRGDGPGVRGLATRQQAGQGGFTGPVQADHADPVALFNGEGESLEHLDGTIGLGYGVRFDDRLAPLAGEGEFKMNGP